MRSSNFVNRLIKALDNGRIEAAEAHCDYPCGIYDPYLAQVSALTVVRMGDLMSQLPKPDPSKQQELLGYMHDIARAVEVKEKHAELCKHEVRILWGDYFKPEHAKEFPQLNEMVWNIMKFGGKAKQEPDRKAAMDLLNEVNKLAEIFWKTKKVETYRAKAPYPPNEEMVYPRLS
jgi:nickel superoxide dismutase